MPRGLSRLVAAAVVNKSFCASLLDDPVEAITVGYYGEPFFLEPEEQNLIFSIQATSLDEFAMQLTNTNNQNKERILEKDVKSR